MKRKIITYLLVVALPLASAAQSTDQPKRSIFPKIYSYHTDHGPVLDLSTLDNNSCTPIYGIDSTITAYMKQHHIVGASLAVMRNDSLLYVKGYGYADKEAGEKMQPWHRMRIASVSKLVTAVGIMKLVDQRRLELSDSVFAKGGALEFMVPPVHDPRIESITVEHLLRHQGGFTCKGGDPMFSVGAVDGDKACYKNLGEPLDFTPGTDQDYSNVGYYLLGKLISVITGYSYEEWTRKYVLSPMQCNDFSIGGNYLEDRQDREVKYYMYPGAPQEEDFHGGGVMCETCYGGNNVTGVQGAGAWISCASDLCRMVSGINIDSGIYDILTPDTIKTMTRETGEKDYAIGWLDTNSVGIWTRTGSFGGTTALVRYYSWDGDCWVLLTNTGTIHHARIVKYSSALIMELRSKYLNSFAHKDLFYER